MRFDRQLAAPGLFGPASLAVFSEAIQDSVDDIGDRHRLPLRPSLRIGIVARPEARMLGRLPVADVLITHRLYSRSGGLPQRRRCIHCRQRRSQFAAWSAVSRTPDISV